MHICICQSNTRDRNAGNATQRKMRELKACVEELILGTLVVSLLSRGERREIHATRQRIFRDDTEVTQMCAGADRLCRQAPCLP